MRGSVRHSTTETHGHLTVQRRNRLLLGVAYHEPNNHNLNMKSCVRREIAQPLGARISEWIMKTQLDT